MSKLRNSRPDTLQRSSPSCRLPGCCSAAVMPWLPPACLVGVRVMQELVSIDWIKDSENPNIQTGRSQNCQYLQNGLSRDSTSSRQWMNFWLRQLCRRWGTTTGTCAARWCCLPSRLVSNEEKHNMAQKLLNFETPEMPLASSLF